MQARNLHPDVNPDPASQEQFQQVNQAYETLSDPEKRAQHDAQLNGRMNFGQTRSHHASMHDIFAHMFGHMHGNSPFNQRPTRNSDMVFQLNVTLEEAYQGKQVPINFLDSHQKPIQVQVNIPPGAEDGMRLRYAGNGDRSHSQFPPGDLIIIIHVEPHKTWTRSGAHLHKHVHITLWNALVGDQLQVTCIDGQTVKVTVPELSVHDTVLKVPQKGMRIRNNHTRGDMFLHVKVIMPERLTEHQREQIHNWKQAG
jgi:DnaJ-class molecular chaperone